MKLDGPVLVYRWPNVARLRRDGVVFQRDLDLILRLPFGDGADHPEGMTIVQRRTRGSRRLMIVFEKTSPDRRRGANTVEARLFSI